MQHFENLLSVCYSYKQGKYSIEEFQSRITTAAIPDNLSKEFLTALVHFDNRIEEILFCNSELEDKKYAGEAADDLINATIEEQERLKSHSVYKNNL